MKPTYTIRRIPVNYGYGFRFELFNTDTGNILETQWRQNLISPRWMRLKAARLNIIARQIGVAGFSEGNIL